MWKSVRARLTAWHMLVLALVLMAFAMETRAFLVDLTRRRTEQLLQETARAFVHTFSVEADESQSVEEAAIRAANEFRFSAYRVLVYSENHQLVAVSDSTDVVPGLAVRELTTSAVAPLHHLLTPASLGRPAFGVLRIPGRIMRAYAVRVNISGSPFLIAALELEGAEDEIVASYLQSTLISIPLALALAGLGGYFLARKSLAPVTAMSEQAVHISSQNLHERLSVTNPDDELGRLAAAFNDLLMRLQQSFSRQQQFMADASHELRTPVSIMSAEADIALFDRSRAPVAYQRSLEVVQLEANRMKHIVEDLFTLARADAGDRTPSMEKLFLEELLSDCVRALTAPAQLQGVRISYTPSVEAPFYGNEDLLKRLICNLLDNAIKHAGEGGYVAVDLVVRRTRYVITVGDTGDGIPAEALPHIFERFYRLDPARTRAGSPSRGGAGLGLSIAQWAAQAHEGSLQVKKTGPSGTVFELILPLSTAASTSQRRQSSLAGT